MTSLQPIITQTLEEMKEQMLKTSDPKERASIWETFREKINTLTRNFIKEQKRLVMEKMWLPYDEEKENELFNKSEQEIRQKIEEKMNAIKAMRA